MASLPAEQITHDRTELKYRIEPARVTQLMAAVSKHLPEHRFVGEGANRLPRARHYVTTVYFDTPSYALYRAVLADESNLKLRAREYYDVHPELLEMATHPNELVRHTPVLWVEVKHKVDGRTQKRRLGIPKRHVVAFFEHGVVSDAMRALQSGTQVIEELLALRSTLGEPLRASCIVNYRRTAYQDAQGALRVTIDQRLGCFAPAPGLFDDDRALSRERLGAPAFEEPRCVVEVKTLGKAPEWLEGALRDGGAEASSYSKFSTASRAVQDFEARAKSR